MDAIVAVYDDWGIGCEGDQPIALSADRKFFRRYTAGSTVIVGRKTVGSFPGQAPLPKRRNILLTRQEIQMPGFTRSRDYKYGKTLITLYRRQSEGEDA